MGLFVQSLSADARLSRCAVEAKWGGERVLRERGVSVYI